MKEVNMVAPVSVDALLRAAVSEGAEYRDDGLCVVGIFGKSNMQLGALKESLINTLADKHVFSVFGGADEEGGGIQALYNPDNRVLYLLLTSVCDGQQLLRACRSQSASTGHADAHDFWKGLERQHCLRLLYLFSVCHVLLLVHPNHTFDVTYDRLFRALDALRQKALPLIRAAVKDCPVSKEWKVNCRPCPPRLLFVFQMSGTLKVSNGSESGVHPDKPKKHSPRRRLQHALEDQIYRIFRKSRVLTNQSSNCLFTVPANQAFVYVAPAPDEDPVGALLGQLRSNCVLTEHDSGAPVSGPRRYQQMRRSTRQATADPAGGAAMSAPPSGDGGLKEFLWQHVELVLTKKGFDDSVGRNPQPCHFELPSFSKWAQVALKLYQVLAGSSEDDSAEPAVRLQAQLKVLDGFLDADAKFSENRCQKALPLAHGAYQANLPHNYTTAVHKNQLAQALRVYSQHARGVAFQRYALQLHDDCYKFWSNGHQLCEERSLSDQHCVHKFHLLPQDGENTDVDHNPPILNHNSRGRSTSSCNCGRKQAPREDPFDVQAANYDFYQGLEEKCCCKLERINFPIFQPSTPDPSPASDRAPRPCEADGERPKESTGAVPGHTPGDTSLSLALSLGQSTDSLGPYGEGEPSGDGQAQQKRPSLADRQPSTVEYLPGMMHSGCPKGLLPKFSSWSLVKLGPAKSYNCHVGLEQPGFLPGASFLLPWDLLVRSRLDDDPSEPQDGGASSWPAPNKTPAGKRGGAGGPGRSRRRDDTARAYVGFEYEDGRGRRFISAGPDKVVKALGSGGAKEPAGRVLNADMPLYVPSPTQGRGVKPHFAQLIRLFVVVPDAPLEVTLSPQVQPGPPPCPLFHPELPEVTLPPDCVWVLRFPYAYATELGPCYPPKENQPLANYKVLRGILRATNTQPQ
ncbi:nonsense-mediated mRNA decay factor SMG8 [Corythoichthys intestinalis]|uniref:nonsense-mediated mRNA decay factor SMG8 n=1 Tax=Corythoichthys intestinalis TaxID=161448 RepID=UPI0025A4F922|nr:nonsense-mediated mRNA decay factor SMG8 [Corythoichthys intestinalis]XP_061801867.1 nonsense-mediated mRNA decay factor SMG8-like [Nerophis lumbriciformis]